MKVHEHMIITLTLLLTVKGMTVSNISLLEGEPFIFHLPDLPHGSNITTVEWKHERNKSRLLAIIYPDNDTIETFAQRSRLEFMKNGSIYIRDVQQEDAGIYTCKIIFKNGRTETHTLSLTLHSEKSWTTPVNLTTTPLVRQPVDISKIALPVGLGLSGLVLLGGVILLIFKCRKKRNTSDESIYVNLQYRKQQPKPKRPEMKDM